MASKIWKILVSTFSFVTQRVFQKTDGVEAADYRCGYSQAALQCCIAEQTAELRELNASLLVEINERRQVEAALLQSKQEADAFMNAAPCIVYVIDQAGRLVRWNRKLETLLGYTSEELVERDIQSLVAEGDHDTLQAVIAEILDGTTVSRDLCLLAKDGRMVPIYVTGTRIVIEEGKIFVVGVGVDISDYRAAMAALRKSEQEYRTLVEAFPDAVIVFDYSRRPLYMNSVLEKQLGILPGDLTGEWKNNPIFNPDDIANVDQALTEFIASGSQRRQGPETRLTARDGQVRWFDLVFARTEYIGQPAVLVITRDITEQKRVEARLLHDALHDHLTGLPNRALLMDRIKYAVQVQKRHPDHLFAVLYMDLDRFKDVNDSLGHSDGDELLIAVARRIQDCLRSCDTLARLGGDELVILLSEVKNSEEAELVARRIQEKLKRPFDLHGLQVFTSASIGLVLCDATRQNPEEILRDADIAMYRAKESGKARHQIFDATMHSQVFSKLHMENDLRRALAEDELEINYQPILSVNTGHILGFEALARWNHPSRGLISPSEFIPLAEDSLLIIPLDRWMMLKACRQMRLWQERYPLLEDCKINVNLSGKQFTQPDMLEMIESILQTSGLPARSLCIEITESVIMGNIEQARQILQKIQALGVWIEIDDFGTGFSSLTYLFQLPVNTLKIDHSFVRNLGKDNRTTEVVRAIVTLAHHMEIDVVAEGVETQQQQRLLLDMGCDQCQGFYHALPMDLEAVEAYLSERSPLPRPLC
jgi:diguanylate cyclase (GGDEF)-like protein/PAS domain S-box-containing protein